jgi:uncharacterized tellurite resistance protein B-like protein
MFLDEFDLRQKSSFLALVTRVVLADGEVAPEEDAVITRLKTELGEDVLAPPEEVFGETNVSVFPTRRSRLIAFLELMISAHADEKIHPDESTVLSEVSSAFELDGATVENLSDWARRYVADAGGNLQAMRAEAESLIDG